MSPLIQLASIFVLGIAAQWLAWRLRFPSILLLLLVGFAAGPVAGLLHPDELFGDLLFPFVSLSVAIVLLEGGLSLRLRDLQGAGGAVHKLLLVGAPIGFGLTTIAARYLLDMPWGLSTLLGAIMVVTGPTVIVPLVQHVRPTGKIGSIAKWEGIVNDPIGAILAVLVLQALLAAEADDAARSVAEGLVASAGVGVGFGLVAAALLVVILRYYLVPDFLHSAVALMLGVASFTAANSVVPESGLLAVTLMGVVLANQRLAIVEHIVEFKENLRVLLIAGLFIVLAARVPMEQIERIDLRSLAFLGALILVIRPLQVAASTLGTPLGWRERVFLGLMAPRGIVAAAVASVFALELDRAGQPGGDRLVSVVFLVIVGTVAVYGLSAPVVARRLGLSQSDPQGVLILGAHDWSRRIAHALRDAGYPVLLVDTNRNKFRAARMEGLDAYHGSILSEDFLEAADLGGIGRFLALSSNNGVNSLAAVELASLFGRSNVYQLSPGPEAAAQEEIPSHLRGRILFEADLTYWDLNARFREGSSVKKTPISAEFTFERFLDRYGEDAVVLAVSRRDGTLRVATAGEEIAPGPGDEVLALVREREGTAARERETARAPG